MNDKTNDSKPTVQLEFALGDFDNSAIANIEENIVNDVKKDDNTYEEDSESD